MDRSELVRHSLRSTRALWLVVVLLIGAPLPGNAQEVDRAQVAAQVETAKARLQLSADQEKALRELLHEQADTLKGIRDADGSRREKMQKAKAAQADFRGRLEKILDPKQLAEWDKMRDELKEKARERRR